MKIFLICKLKMNTPNGYVLVTILKPQPSDKHKSHHLLGKQIQTPIQKIVTERPFDQVNLFLFL